jgi:glycosyltransferase involved in cell wall biosynthesis
VRIVFDGQPLLPPLSGIGHYTSQLVRALARADASHEYLLFHLHPVRRPSVQPRMDFTEPAVRMVWQGWWTSVRARVLRKLGRATPVESFVGPFDVFHATNYLFAHEIAAARRVVTVHDLTLLLFPDWHPTDRLRQMVPRLIRSLAAADHIVVDSAATREDLLKELAVDAGRVSVVPLAADPTFRPLPRAQVAPTLHRLGLEVGGYLLFVGTLEPRKNLVRLFDALEAAGPDIGPLVVAGADGWGSQEIRKRMRRLEGSGRVNYLGYVDDAARPALMSGARAFVYPSLYEGFGLPPLEAMACGTPVLTSPVSSIPEVVGDAALLVGPEDTPSIADALRRLWTDADLRAALSERGLAQAARFSWDRTAVRMLEIYRTVAGAAGQPVRAVSRGRSPRRRAPVAR